MYDDRSNEKVRAKSAKYIDREREKVKLKGIVIEAAKKNNQIIYGSDLIYLRQQNKKERESNNLCVLVLKLMA